MSEFYYDFDHYMAHVQQMVHIRPQRSHHLGICPTMVLRLVCHGKDTVIECSQEVITCFTSASTAITCQPGSSLGFSERDNTEHKIGTDP